MAIEYVGGTSGSRNGNSNATTTQSLTALTGGIASAPAQNDIVIVVCVVGSQGRNAAQAISGYNTLGTQLNPNTTTYDTSLQVSWKRMTATPDTSITIPAQGNAADGQAWAVMVFRGVDTTTAFDVTSVSATGTATGRFDAPAITPTTAGSWIVIAGGGAAATGAAYTAPTDFATDWVAPSNGADTNDAMAAMGYYTGWTSGSYNPAAVGGGTTNAADSWAAWTMALRPQQTQTYSYTASGGYSFGGAATAARARGVTPSGGLTFAGAAEALRYQTKTGDGGIVFGGTATVDFVTSTQTYSYTMQGGITFSGAATAARARAHAAAGGLTLSGAATAARARAHSATGGLVLSGTATAARARAHSATGGITFSGTATAARARAHSATGGITLSGAATAARARNVVASGGIVIGGEVAARFTRVVNSQGGITFSGTAGKSFVYVGQVDGVKRWYRLGLGV